MAVTLDQADTAIPAIHLNGATTIEKAAEPMEVIAFHPVDTTATMPLHTPPTIFIKLSNTKLNARSRTLPGD
jgi:hypothetical protein